MNAHAPRVPMWRRRQRVLLLIGGAFFCALLFPLIVVKASLAHWERVENDRLRVQGFPVTAEEMRTFPSRLPSVDEVFPDYLPAVRAFAQAASGGDCAAVMEFLLQGEALGLIPGSIREQFHRCRERNTAALEQIYLPANGRPCQLSIDVETPDQDTLKGMLHSARWLAEAARLDFEEGDMPRASEAIAAGLASGRFLAHGWSGPSAQLYRMGINRIMTETLQYVSGRAGLAEAQWRQLQEACHAAQAPEALARALAGARVLAATVYYDPSVFVMLYGAPARWLGKLPGGEEGVLRTANAFGWNSFDRLRSLHVMNELILASQHSLPEAMKVIQRIPKILQKHPVVIPKVSQRLLPDVRRMADSFFVDITRLRAGETVAAIARFRLRHGWFPERLSELVPVFIDAVPEDPCDGAPLRYKLHENGYMLYSVSKNLADDGGVPGIEANDWNTEGDWVFQVDYGHENK